MPCFSPRLAALVSHAVGWPLMALAVAARLDRLPRFWLLELADAWLLHLLAPWTAVALLAAARTRSPALALLAAVAGALAWVRGRSALGRGRKAAPTSAATLSVLTANVLTSNPSAEGLATLIASGGYELVALQEVRPGFGADLVARIGPDLPHYDLRPDEGFAGAAVFSRWPIDKAEALRLTPESHICQHVQLVVEGRRLHVFNVHLGTMFSIYRRERGLPAFGIRRSSTRRDIEIERLVHLIAEINEPTILLGDWNVSAGSRPHRLLLRHLRDTFREVGRGLGHTFPQAVSIHGLFVPLPLLRIDYIFTRGCLEPLSAGVLPQPRSDHRAVSAELELV